MASRRKAHLDALERSLTGPKRIALFGHRAVGKTTLLAMFYREAAAGRVPGVRLAASRPSTAEYLAERIAQIESGDPLPATLAETELHLRLYHGGARLDLIVKDYQGEHVALGVDAPIREFFLDCDAVLLCLSPEGPGQAAERRRRQQEVEDLLERYIDASQDATTGRPVALLVTKYDHVIAQGGPAPDHVESLVGSQFGMTLHALRQHAPRSALFGVSSYGLGAVDDRPPADLRPLGLEAPLIWLAEQLEAVDRERLEWLWDLAPEDYRRLHRCVTAFEQRYPRSDRLDDYHRRLARLRRQRWARRGLALAGTAAVLLAGLAGYDALGYQSAVEFERAHPPTVVERNWRRFLDWHPSLAYFWPEKAQGARQKLHEWAIKSAAQRIAVGTAPPDLAASLTHIKDEAPELAAAVDQVQETEAARRHEARWQSLRAEDLAGPDRPDDRANAYRAFLREFPDTAHRDEAQRLLANWEQQAAEKRSSAERAEVDAIERELALPDTDLPTIVEKAVAFLDAHAESTWRSEVERLMEEALGRIDLGDIQRARDFSRQFPTNFATRLGRYQAYLNAHQGGGKYTREALDAIEKIERERDVYAYRQAYDHAQAHGDDVAEIARRLRSYLEVNPQGRFAEAAKDYVAWWDKISTPSPYRVTLLRGEVEPDVAKYLSGGGPDLAVAIWVGGVKYGPSAVAPNSYQPIWNYTFPQPIIWKYGDPVNIQILDFDWSTSGTRVFQLRSPKDDPLALRFLANEITPTKGGKTRLVFRSDFRVPDLPRPE